jgi:hypothetical protein
LSLAFEYQGEPHYFSTITYGRASERQRVDKIKIEEAAEEGITVIHVPFWWNRSLASLAATIQSKRPEITFRIPVNELPIPLEMPAQYYKRKPYKANVAQKLNDKVNPTGWYVYNDQLNSY